MLLVLRPENPCQTWDPRAKFRVLYRIELKVEGPPFEPRTSAQLAGSASVLVRVSPLTPTRCNPVAFGFKTRESVFKTWDPRAKFRVLYRIELKVGGSAVRAPDLGPTSGKCQCAGEVCPLRLLGVTPLLLVLRPENPCQTWDPRAKFRVLYRIELKVEGPPFEPRTSAQLAGSASVLVRVSPLTPTRCNPVAFGFKTRESVSNLGPPGQISCFISYRTQSWRVRRSSPGPRPN